MDWNQFDKIYILAIPKNLEDAYDIITKDNLQNVIIFQAIKNVNQHMTNYKGIPVISLLDNPKHSNRLNNCYSHKEICKHAQKNGYKKIMIFEDDAKKVDNISENTWKNVSDWIKNNKWDIFFLGHLLSNVALPVNSYIDRTYGSIQAHAFCITEKMIDRIINFYNPSDEGMHVFKKHNKKGKPHGFVDTFLRSECMDQKAYSARPNLYYQQREVPEIEHFRNNYIFKHSSVEDWPENINRLFLFISIILVFGVPLFILCIMLWWYRKKEYKMK